MEYSRYRVSIRVNLDSWSALVAICCLLKYYEIINRSSVANNEFLLTPPNAVQLPHSVKECPTIHEVVGHLRSSSLDLLNSVPLRI